MKYLVFRRRSPVTRGNTTSDVLVDREKDDDTEDGDERRSHPLLRLHRQHGNRAVSKFVENQREDSIPVTTPDNKSEQVADDLALQVSSEPATSEIEASSDLGGSEIEFAGTAPETVEAVIDDEGEPLDDGVRAEAESAFGIDLADVRVHTGTRAAESTDDVDARAYTVGDHIVFGQGEYTPETTDGKETIAHELAHVVQQTRATDGTQEQPVLQRKSNATAESEDDTLTDESERQQMEQWWDTRSQSIQAERVALEAELAAVTARDAIRRDDLDEARESGNRAETLAARAAEVATRTAEAQQETDLEPNRLDGKSREFDPVERAMDAADRAVDAVDRVTTELEPLETEDTAAFETVEEADTAEDPTDETVVSSDAPPVANAITDLTQRVRSFMQRVDRLNRVYEQSERMDTDDELNGVAELKERVQNARRTADEIKTDARELNMREIER